VATVLLFASGFFNTPYNGAKLWFAIAWGTAVFLLSEYLIIGLFRWFTLGRMHLQKIRS
jgi:hypothetical protein